jgi:hypothetical protein
MGKIKTIYSSGAAMDGSPETKNPPEVAASEGYEAQTGGHHVKQDDSAIIVEYRSRRMAAQRSIASVLRVDAVNNYSGRWPGDVHRVINCLWCAAGVVEVVLSVEFKRAHYKGLQTCGSVWLCPCCAAKIEERRRGDVVQAFAMAEKKGFDTSLHTNTFPHGIGDGLALLLRKQAAALAAFRQHSAYKKIMKDIGYVGMIRALELMHGDNGWHPHTHELKIHKESVSQKDWDWIRGQLIVPWRVSCERAGIVLKSDPDNPTLSDLAFKKHALDIKAHFNSGDYLNKTDEQKNWTPSHEIAKASSKAGRRSGMHPFQLAIKGTQRAAELFVEYAHAMKGKRKLFFSPGLKKLAGIVEKTDEELAAQEDDRIADSANISRLWSFIKARDRRQNTRVGVLEVFETSGKDGLAQYIYDLGFDPTKENNNA